MPLSLLLRGGIFYQKLVTEVLEANSFLRAKISTKNIFMNWKHRLIPFKDMWIYVVLLSARCKVGTLCASTRITVI